MCISLLQACTGTNDAREPGGSPNPAATVDSGTKDRPSTGNAGSSSSGGANPRTPETDAAVDPETRADSGVGGNAGSGSVDPGSTPIDDAGTIPVDDAGPAAGEVFFQNAGVRAGWSGMGAQHKGSVDVVSSPVFKGNSAISCTQRYDHSGTYTKRYHAEAVIFDVGKRGWDRYYGFAFYLPSDWQVVNQTFILSQFGVDIPNCGGPSAMLYVEGTRLRTVTRTGRGYCESKTHRSTIVENIARGEWHTVVWRVKHESDATGVNAIWYDGKLALEEKNLQTAYPTDLLLRWSIGLYANQWAADVSGLQPPDAQDVKTIVVDHARVASTLEAADPARWNE